MSRPTACAGINGQIRPGVRRHLGRVTRVLLFSLACFEAAGLMVSFGTYFGSVRSKKAEAVVVPPDDMNPNYNFDLVQSGDEENYNISYSTSARP